MAVHAAYDERTFTAVWHWFVNCTVDHRSCCSHPTSHWSIDRYLSEMQFLRTHLHLAAFPSEYCHRRLVLKKLEWCGYRRWQKFWRYVYSFQQHSRTWWTDRHRLHSITQLKLWSKTFAVKDCNFLLQKMQKYCLLDTLIYTVKWCASRQLHNQILRTTPCIF